MIGGLYIPHIRTQLVQVVIPPTSPGSLVFSLNGLGYYKAFQGASVNNSDTALLFQRGIYS
jgi:hypothetical protein